MDLDLTYCAQCAYDLTGLPNRGTCPECGNAYDMATGKGLQRDPKLSPKANWFVKHLRTIMLLVSAAMVITCSGVVSMAGHNTTKILATGAFITFIILFGALASYMYENNPD